MRTLIVALCVLVLTSCSPFQRTDERARVLEAMLKPGAPVTAKDGEAEAASAGARKRSEPTLIKGNDTAYKLTNPAAETAGKTGKTGAEGKRGVASADATGVTLKFEQASITEVVHAVLGDMLDVSYSVHQPLAGDVTLHTASPIPKEKVLAVLETVLLSKGVLMVQDPEGIYHVGTNATLKGLMRAPVKIGAQPFGHSVVIVPLQYIGVAEMADILKPFAKPESVLRADALRNILILSGTKTQLDTWADLIDIFDVDVLKGMSLGLFPLEYVSTQEVDAALKAIAGGATGSSASSGAAPAAPAAPAAGATAGAAATSVPMVAASLPGPLAGVLRIVPIERLNAILVVTSRSYYLEQAREWIQKLDRPRDGGGEAQLYVYPVQNGTAEHLARLLSAVFGSTQTTPTATRNAAGSGVAPGLGESTLGNNRNTLNTNSTNAFGGMQPLSGNNAAGGTTQATISQVTVGNIRVVADDLNNALLIYAPKSDYLKIEGALRRLDVAPLQVLIEASILEVTLTDTLKYGLQWTFQGGLGAGESGTGTLSAGTSGSLGASYPGFSYSFVSAAGNVKAVLNALADKSLINVISSPSLMVLDNHTATIQVGDQQPIRSSTSTTDGGVTTSSIQYKDTGVMLSVTPSVNAGGLVSMMIKQSVTDVGSIDAATGQRSFLQRQVQSKVAVRSGDTVVLGGLIKDNSTVGKQGVPLLQDIPLLGNLFSTTNNSGTRTELLVLITPKLIQTENDMREVGAEMRRRMRGLIVQDSRVERIEALERQ